MAEGQGEYDGVPDAWHEGLGDDILSDADEEKQKIAQKRLARMTRHYRDSLSDVGFSSREAFLLTRDLHWAMLELSVQTKMNRHWREDDGE
jgi:hypothetical protein